MGEKFTVEDFVLLVQTSGLGDTIDYLIASDTVFEDEVLESLFKSAKKSIEDIRQYIQSIHGPEWDIVWPDDGGPAWDNQDDIWPDLEY